MSYLYYIVDIINGEIKGTDSNIVASSLADSEDFFVINVTLNKWIQSNDQEIDIEQFKE